MLALLVLKQVTDLLFRMKSVNSCVMQNMHLIILWVDSYVSLLLLLLFYYLFIVYSALTVSTFENLVWFFVIIF